MNYTASNNNVIGLCVFIVALLIMFGGVGWFFLHAHRCSRRRMQLENNRAPEYEESIGVGFRGFGMDINFHYPFARCSLYSDMMVVSFMRSLCPVQYAIPYRFINEVETKGFFIFKTVYVTQTSPSAPAIIRIWIDHPERFKTFLLELIEKWRKRMDSSRESIDVAADEDVEAPSFAEPYSSIWLDVLVALGFLSTCAGLVFSYYLWSDELPTTGQLEALAAGFLMSAVSAIAGAYSNLEIKWKKYFQSISAITSAPFLVFAAAYFNQPILKYCIPGSLVSWGAGLVFIVVILKRKRFK
jgi:hypothetical protein